MELIQDPTWRSKIKKDPGIPNLFPFKDKILAEIEEKKRQKQEEQLRIREEARERRKAEKKAAGIETADDEDEDDEIIDDIDIEDDDEDVDGMDEDGDSSNPMAALLASARARAAEYEENDDEMSEGYDEDEDEDRMDEDGEQGGVSLQSGDIPTIASQVASKESSRRAFDKVFKQVAQAADVILYVLDARDPEGTRSKDVEREIMAAEGGSKRLILILNKIDLVPPAVLKGWLIHLRRYFPTLPLKASNGAPNAHSFDHKQLTVKGTSETLFKALKSYSQTSQLKRAISVGVIGYPNVGKSSVINALTARLNRGRSNACPTGAEAGVTTSLREVKLDSKLKLIDSPGIVFPNSSKASSKKKKENDEARLVLLNAVPPKQITDPIPAVNLLLKRLQATNETLFQKMLSLYGINSLFPMNGGDTTTDFLIQVARNRGRLGKGGVPNIASAAMAVITDWRDGRIQGWLEPPVLAVAGVNTATSDAATAADNGPAADVKEIVTEWAKEFNIEGLWGNGESEE